MNKKFRTLISAVLVFALAFGVFSVGALAADTTKIVFFGDITSQGYMFPDYGLRASGYNAASSSGVAKRLLNYVRSNEDPNAELQDFSFKTLGYDELYALLNAAAERTEDCAANIKAYSLDFGNESNLVRAMENAITAADTIVIDLGMGDFTALITECFNAVEETEYGVKLDALLPKVNDSLKAAPKLIFEMKISDKAITVPIPII